MKDTRWIAVGMAVFLIGASFPVWRAATGNATGELPVLGRAKAGSTCVEDTAFMRAQHMNLLEQWRNAVVRNDSLTYTSTSGQQFRMSLTGTCLDCHQTAVTFCTRCHDYAGVKPSCWNCHLEQNVTGS